MRISSWLTLKNYKTQMVIIWAISGGAHHSKRDNMTLMIGKSALKLNSSWIQTCQELFYWRVIYLS